MVITLSLEIILALLLFNLGENLDNYSFNVAASHSDSPTFKVKENAEIEIKR